MELISVCTLLPVPEALSRGLSFCSVLLPGPGGSFIELVIRNLTCIRSVLFCSVNANGCIT